MVQPPFLAPYHPYASRKKLLRLVLIEIYVPRSLRIIKNTYNTTYLFHIIRLGSNRVVARTCLAKVLKEKKITKYRFAKLIGAEYSNIVRYFKPEYDPRLSTLEKWSKALDVSVKDLIED